MKYQSRNISESEIQKSILDYLSTVPDLFCFKSITSNKRGIPDIIICYKGRFIALEVKSPTGQVAEIQKLRISEIQNSKGRALVVRNLQQVKDLISEES